MSAQVVQRRTGWDIALGVLLVIAGIVVLGNTVVATLMSVRFLGWVALIVGIVEIVGALVRLKQGIAWSTVLGGALLFVLGLLILRNTLVAAATLTLIAAALILAGGIVRVVLAFSLPEHRVGLLVSGIASTLLGLLVLFNFLSATLTLLGILLGVQTLLEGFTILFFGRIRQAQPVDALP